LDGPLFFTRSKKPTRARSPLTHLNQQNSVPNPPPVNSVSHFNADLTPGSFRALKKTARQGGLQSHCSLGLSLITLSVAYLDTRSDPNSSIAVPHRPTASPVAVWNVYGYRFSVVHWWRTSRRYPKKRAQCQSTKQGRYKIVPRCRLLRRDASKRYGNCTARNRNPLHVALSKVTP
jgi:hypothetical protein